MFKSLVPMLNRAMPVMMAAFLILAVIQVAVMLHLSLDGFWRALNWARPAYLPLAGIGALLTVMGLGYETSAEKLARRGLRRRKGLIMDVLSRLTNRGALEELMAREQRETVIDAEELAASLRARVISNFCNIL